MPAETPDPAPDLSSDTGERANGLATPTPPANPGPAAASPASRQQSLDVLRGVAVLLVLGAHAEFPTDWPPPVRWLTDAWTRCGWVGVDLFFVLSGFLVAGLVFNEWRETGRFAVGRFLIRRGFKIFPAYYTLWLLVLVYQVGLGRGLDAARLMNDFLFIQNYGPSEWGHTWSLAVEEHFYLGLALLCWLRVRLNPNSRDLFAPLAAVASVIIVTCPLLRWLTPASEPFVHLRHIFPTHLRIDSLMYGVAASWVWTFHRGWIAGHFFRRRGRYLAAGCLLLLPTLFFRLETTRWMHVWGFSVFAVAGLCLVLWALGRSRPSTQPVMKALAWIGFYSYSIYLWHIPVARFLAATVGGYLTTDWWPFCFLAASIVVGVYLGKIIEWPMVGLRDRWFPRRA